MKYTINIYLFGKIKHIINSNYYEEYLKESYDIRRVRKDNLNRIECFYTEDGVIENMYMGRKK